MANFIACVNIIPGELGEDVLSEGTADNQDEPVTGKKARLEQDFEQKTGHTTADEEIREYFSTPHTPTIANALEWWAHNQEHFPRLANLSKRYLAVQATSTPSKIFFFTGWEYDY